MKKNVILLLVIIILINQVSSFEFCQDGEQGENEIRLISVNDMLKENSKEWKWETSQKIEIETRVENKNDDEATYIIEAIFKDKEKTIKIAKDSDDLKKEFSLSSNQRKSISLEFKTNKEIDAKKYNLYIKFYKKNNEDRECVENSEEKIEIEKIEICKNGKVSENDLELDKIKDKTEDNEREWEWEPGSNIEISLNLENKDYSKRDFEIELIFLNENNEKISLIKDIDDAKKEENLDKNENEKINFNFALKSGITEGYYKLYAKAYDKNDEDICTSLKAETKSSPIRIKIKRPKRKVIVTKVTGPKSLETSSNAQYTAKITNLGSKTEERIQAVIYSKLLKIKEKIMFTNLKAGKEKTITFNISIPENATLKKHAIIFSTEYEYNEKQDYYNSESKKEDDIKYYVTISKKKEIPKIITPTNKTIIKEPIDNATKIPKTTITGNVIGTPKESPNWIILIGFLIIIIIGIYLFFKKPKKPETPKTAEPKIIKRYTAKL